MAKPLINFTEKDLQWVLEDLKDVYPIAGSLTPGELESLKEDIYTCPGLFSDISLRVDTLCTLFLEHLETLDRDGKR